MDQNIPSNITRLSPDMEHLREPLDEKLTAELDRMLLYPSRK